jgi:hypothetical protein
MISQLRLRKKHLPAHCLQIGWILIYSSVGGLNSLLSLYFGLLVFRATNRFSIFISAIVLLFVVSRLARLTRGWPRAASIALAMVVAGVGLYDQIPRPQSETEVAVLRARLHSDQMLGEKLEAELPAGAMVFQLPVVDFPETRPPNNLADYEHLRLFLGTKTLRFSYGALKGHSAVHWQYDYERMEPQAMAAALEQSGFAAICIDRRGYADNGKALLDGLNAAGRPVMAESELGEFVVVRLQPVLHPRPPLARGLTFGQGWNPHETGDEERLRWTSGSACVSFFNPYDRPITALMRFRVSGVDPRHFILRVYGHEQFRASVGLDPVEVVLPRIELQPGANRFDLQTFEPSVRVSQERSRLRALALRDLGFRVLPESLPAP